MSRPGQKRSTKLPHPRVIAILTAAGSGSRFSKLTGRLKLPKQFAKIHGREVFLCSLAVLQQSKLIDEIVITAHKRYFDLVHKRAVKNNITKLSILVEGSKTRFESVRNAAYRINAKPDDLILIHDAVRPNINVTMVEALVKQSKKFGEVIPVLTLGDTIKAVSNSYVRETLDRENLRAVQTPQIFRYRVLMDSYRKNRRRKDFTDESALVESAGYRVRIVEGSKDNIKITTPEDVETIRNLIKAKQTRLK